MAEEIRCSCCHRKIDLDSLPVCGYCGYFNTVIVGDSEYADKGALQHRRTLLEKLKDISVAGYEYGWNDQTKKFDQLSRKPYKIADGLDCDRKVIWGTQEFGQWWDESAKTVPVEISFQFGGNWKVTRNFLPLDSSSFWHIGVEVTEEMSLVIYFGNEKNYAKSPGIDFVSLLSK